MSIVTISRGVFSKGREIAEKTAERLGYKCISREILLEASERFNVPELKLFRAIHDSPSLLERLGHSKKDYVAYIRVSLLRNLQSDNVIYHGLAGHFFVSGISHVLRVRIIADMEERINDFRLLDPESKDLSREEALRILEKNDDQRRKWSMHLYGIDTMDPSLYDLVIHLGNIGVDDAVDIICNTVNMPPFRTTPESQQALDALLLLAEIKAAFVGLQEEAEVTLDGDTLTIWPKLGKSLSETSKHKIEKRLKEFHGVKQIKFNPADTPYLNPWHKI